MKARLIYNPISGHEIIKRHIADILNYLELQGYETSCFQTTSVKDSAKIEAARLCELGNYDLVIVAGGDGTINQVINGMATYSILPKVVIVPTGTTNDFARALKLPRNSPLDAIKVIEKNQTLKVDIGHAVSSEDESYFINIAATGALSELTYSVPSNLKTAFGYLAYLAKGVELLPQIKKVPVRLTYDSGVFEGEASLVFVALTNTVGGFERLAPDAKFDDGLFTVFLVKTDNLVEILALLAMVAQGRGAHMNDVNTEYIKTRKLDIEPLSDKKMLINLDGEFGGSAPASFENLKGKVELFVNLDDLSKENYIGEEKDSSSETIAHKFVEEVDQIKKKAKK